MGKEAAGPFGALQAMNDFVKVGRWTGFLGITKRVKMENETQD